MDIPGGIGRVRDSAFSKSRGEAWRKWGSARAALKSFCVWAASADSGSLRGCPRLSHQALLWTDLMLLSKPHHLSSSMKLFCRPLGYRVFIDSCSFALCLSGKKKPTIYYLGLLKDKNLRIIGREMSIERLGKRKCYSIY